MNSKQMNSKKIERRNIKNDLQFSKHILMLMSGASVSRYATLHTWRLRGN
jgi:hypothetical protein